jgi:hypothetical protein
METLKYKIRSLIQMLDKVIDGFDIIDFETFDAIFPKLVEEKRKADLFRNSLIQEYGVENLAKYNSFLTKKAKLIEQKYDNMVGVFSKEAKRLEKELSANFTKRKIANYLRY